MMKKWPILILAALGACSAQPQKGDKPEAYFYAKEGVPIADYAPQSALKNAAQGAIRLPPQQDYEYDPTLVTPPQIVHEN